MRADNRARVAAGSASRGHSRQRKAHVHTTCVITAARRGLRRSTWSWLRRARKFQARAVLDRANVAAPRPQNAGLRLAPPFVRHNPSLESALPRSPSPVRHSVQPRQLAGHSTWRNLQPWLFSVALRRIASWPGVGCGSAMCAPAHFWRLRAASASLCVRCKCALRGLALRAAC